MQRFAFARIVFVLGLVFWVGACAVEPHVYRASEFDRDRVDFYPPPTDVSEVAICYNRISTTPAVVREMAESECARYRKTAVFKAQEFYNCPLLAPVGAIFECRMR